MNNIDAKQILDQLLQSGQKVAAKGEELFGDKIGLPESGPQREAMLKGLGKGAAAAGVLALLLGTGAGRRLTGTALKLGSVAAIGGIGYTAFKNWQAKSGSSSAFGTSVNELSGAKSEERGRILLQAMIAAAKADGHIDADEQAAIESHMKDMDLGPGLADFIAAELEKPLDATGVAAAAGSTDEAVEIWLASRLVIDTGNAVEKQYLDRLTAELKLPADLVTELESSVASA